MSAASQVRPVSVPPRERHGLALWRQDLDAIACSDRRDQTLIEREQRRIVRLSHCHEIRICDLLMAQQASKDMLRAHEWRKEIEISVVLVGGKPAENIESLTRSCAQIHDGRVRRQADEPELCQKTGRPNRDWTPVESMLDSRVKLMGRPSECQKGIHVQQQWSVLRRCHLRRARSGSSKQESSGCLWGHRMWQSARASFGMEALVAAGAPPAPYPKGHGRAAAPWPGRSLKRLHRHHRRWSRSYA